jgi:MFS family permease
LPEDMDNDVYKNLKHNYISNLIDGGFFGFALGFASFSTVLPLFISTMTQSAVLVGMIPAIHNMGWQLPQLFLARRISKMRHYKKMTLLMTIQERLPFVALAILAWFLPQVGNKIGLVVAFLLLIWQGMGAGFTANPWQNFITRVIPGDLRATFFGAQSAAANLFSSVGAILAGFVLDRVTGSRGFSYCFAIAVFLMICSWIGLAQTREPNRSMQEIPAQPPSFWKNVAAILKRDYSFRWFLASRMLSQFANMAGAFYTVYAVRHHGMTELTAGVMTSVLLITQTAANPLLGWIADRWSRKGVLAAGALASSLSAILAWLSPDLNWFFPVFILFGIGNTAYWTIGMALNLEFGSEIELPTYIGMANTLIAPVTILAPFIGGVLADTAGYSATFIFSAVFGIITCIILFRFVKDPAR